MEHVCVRLLQGHHFARNGADKCKHGARQARPKHLIDTVNRLHCVVHAASTRGHVWISLTAVANGIERKCPRVVRFYWCSPAFHE